jgi:hypothetical protein
MTETWRVFRVSASRRDRLKKKVEAWGYEIVDILEITNAPELEQYQIIAKKGQSGQVAV